MNTQPSPIYWSFSCGNWAKTNVRVSWLLPLLFVLICVRLGDITLGLTISAIILVSVLFHEFGHIFAVRSTGGTGDEILLWPWGGLAAVAPASSFRSRFLTPAAGPLVNLTVCLLTLIPVLGTPFRTAVFYPFEVPISGMSTAPLQDIFILTFWINWIQLLLNLIPVHPFDGGRMLQACPSIRWQSEAASEIYLKVGSIIGLVGIIGGLAADITWIVAIAAFVLVMNLQESFQLRSGESYDDSFMGYDFSQGYTSLERDAEQRPARKPGWLERRRARKREEKERRERERQLEVQQQLDVLLDKIQSHGIESLTDAERRQLEQASALYREKGDLNG